MQKFGLETIDARTYITNNPDYKYRLKRYYQCNGDDYIKMFIKTPGWLPDGDNKFDLMFNRNIIRCDRPECRNDGILVCCGVIYCCGKANGAQCMICKKNYNDFTCDKCFGFSLDYSILQFKSKYEYDKCKTCDETQCRICHNRNECDKTKQLSKLLNNYVIANNTTYKIIKKVNELIICRGGIFTNVDGVVSSVQINDPRITREMIIDMCPLAKGRPSEQEGFLYELLEEMFPGYTFIKAHPDWLNQDREFTKYGKNLEIDFLCAELPLAIEYNGIHHYKDIHNNPEAFARKQHNDAFKVKTMKKLGFPFVVIPHEYKNKISIYRFLCGELCNLSIKYNKIECLEIMIEYNGRSANKVRKISISKNIYQSNENKLIENQGLSKEQYEELGRIIQFNDWFNRCL